MVPVPAAHPRARIVVALRQAVVEGADLREFMKRSPAFLEAAPLTALIVLGQICASAQTVTELVSFDGDNSLGKPTMMLTQGRSGELYGTGYGSKTADGSVFSLTTSGAADGLFAFDGTTGSGPLAGLTLGTDGNYYGATTSGGTYNLGVLFRVSAEGAYTLLHEFSGSSDGAGPIANPIEASDGNFYGTTAGDAGVFPCTIYRYAASGEFTTIFSFDSQQGEIVGGPLVQGSDGNLYGTAQAGGTTDNGTLFKISTAGTLLSVYSFPGGNDGQTPVGALVETSDGSFYGMTNTGGNSAKRAGTVFKMDKTGAVSIIYSFKGDSGGAFPVAGLVLGTDGYLYGTTALGGSGTNGYGTIFKISTSGVYQQLYAFSTTGINPSGPPIQHTKGLFYGNTEYGATVDDEYGTVYQLDMGLGEFITFVRPSGQIGQSAQILGQGFTGATSVTFSGVPAKTFTVKSDTYMTAVVPKGAASGTVEVTTPSGVLKSNVSFHIFQ